MGSIIDLTLGLNAQATAVLHLLDWLVRDQYVENDYGRITTVAHYNGRERGYTLTLQRKLGDRKALVISWSECRGSDGIFVQHEMFPVADVAFDRIPRGLSDASYEKRVVFQYGDVKGAAEHIVGLLDNHLTAYEENESNPKPARRSARK